MKNELIILLFAGVLLFGCVGSNSNGAAASTAPSVAASVAPSAMASVEPSAMPSQAPSVGPEASATPTPVGDDLDVVVDDASQPEGTAPSAEPSYGGTTG